MLIVQKYGGATVATPEKIKQVALRIHDLHSKGNKLVVVVSAMGSTTNELIRLAKEVSKKPHRREMDMLLTTGERVSMSLLSMALIELGTPAVSFTGSQAGIFTDDAHENARIVEVKAFRVEEALKAGKVVVLAGFQGVSPTTKEITTLGRGGSDTTAVAMAAYLKADRCEILKDVPSILTADPRIVKDAKPLHELTYNELIDMTYGGAKVLHFRSAELAKERSVPLYIGPAANANELMGTNIFTNRSASVNASTSQTDQYEKAKILSVNSHNEVLKIQINAKSLSEANQILTDYLKQTEIPLPQILQIEHVENSVVYYLTGPDEVLAAIINNKNASIQLSKNILCSLTITVRGSTSADLIESIAGHVVDYEKIWFHPQSITVLTKKEHRETAVQKLHTLI